MRHKFVKNLKIQLKETNGAKKLRVAGMGLEDWIFFNNTKNRGSKNYRQMALACIKHIYAY